MPYPSQIHTNATTPDSALEFRSNGLTGNVGNAHTARVTTNDLSGSPKEPYASLWPSQWTAVTFDGGDRLRNATNLGLGSTTYDTFTCAVAFQVNTAPAGDQFLISSPHSGGEFFIAFNAYRKLEIVYGPGDTSTGFGFIADAVFDLGVAYVLHIAAKASTNELEVFLNGKRLPGTTEWGFSTPTAPFPRPTSFSIGGTSGAASYVGTLGLVWAHWGVFYNNPSAFWRPYALGAQLANPGVRPTVGFGGVQAAGDWQAGTNLGSGTGTWTPTGTIT